jgi:hypothetical protein
MDKALGELGSYQSRFYKESVALPAGLEANCHRRFGAHRAAIRPISPTVTLSEAKHLKLLYWATPAIIGDSSLRAE